MELVPILTSTAFAVVTHYGELIGLGCLLVLTALVWLASPHFLRLRFLYLIGALVLLLRIFVAATWSYAQYFIWSHDALGVLLLPPHQSWRYFLGYTGLHFWFSIVLAIGVALVAYLFFHALKRYRSRFFEGNEPELAALLCFIVGWPGVLVFIGGTCIGIILVSVFRRVWLGQIYTTLGIPMLIGGALAFLLNSWLIRLLSLGALQAAGRSL